MFTPTTEFGRQHGWELRQDVEADWCVWGTVPDDEGPKHLEGAKALKGVWTLWLALDPELRGPPRFSVASNGDLRELLLSLSCDVTLRSIRSHGDDGVRIRNPKTLADCEVLKELGLVHQILHLGHVRYVAGEPEPSCGSLVPGVRP